jgi:hypothetical protein
MDGLNDLNLLVWARNVTGALASTVTSLSSDPASQLQAIVAGTESLIDPDFTAHACALTEAGSCEIEIGATEDKNRYLDIVLHYEVDAARGGVRVVVAEDAAKALDYPVSFNVLVDALRVSGVNQSREYLGRNLAQADVGRNLDAEGFGWANSSLVDLIVEKTSSWPWQCSPRLARSADFPTELKEALVEFERTTPGKWSVSFEDSIGDFHDTGIAFKVQYALCGHLMFIPVVIQSDLTATSAILV